ncbi:hypothetical protein WJX84_009459 [Apatococcus fuscideae]|uniref:Uncharacterized protein n=1 Tax=Apatococcus fuscideae TaxID=2026836 RepID=A0AAW1T8C3_9CHLO
MDDRVAGETAGLQQALQLLQGPSDERRFVGLLLVSKFVTPGNNHHIAQVQEAVGFTFLQRLLLPLRPQHGATRRADKSQQIAAAEMALAVLSTFSSVPSLAASTEMLEMVPLFSKVAVKGGMAGAMDMNGAASDESTAAKQQQDAVESLLGIAAGSEEGRRVVLESQGVRAAGVALGQAQTAPRLAAPALRLLALLCPPVPGVLLGMTFVPCSNPPKKRVSPQLKGASSWRPYARFYFSFLPAFSRLEQHPSAGLLETQAAANI